MADKANAQPGFEEIARLQAELESALARESASQETRRALLAMLEDLEESQREVEQARREWLDAMDAVQDPIFMHDREYRVLRANRAYAERAGMDVRQVVGKPYWQLFPKLDGPLPSCICALEQRQSDEEELRLPSGEAFLSRHYPILDGEGDCLYSLHIMQDMTEKRRAEAEQRTLSEALRQGEQRFRNLVEASSDWIWEVDAHGIYTYASPKVLDILGYTPDEVIGKTPFDLMPPEEAERIKADFSRLATEKRSIHMLENVNRHKDGRLVVLETNGVPILDAEGGLSGYRGMDRDITERKQAEMALQRALRAQRALSACNAILVHTTEEKHLLAEMCRTIIEEGGYRLAWIGFVEHDAGKSVRPVASAGYEAGYLESLRITWADSERGQGPTGCAVRSGKVEIAHDIAQNPAYGPWREQALQRGYASSIALPLKKEAGEVFGVLNIYAAEAQAFDAAEIHLLQELADDLAFGVLTLRTRRERDHYQLEHLKSADLLKKALIGTIRAIALTVEKRDPYTAGHQSRVANLAAAIAREMGLDADHIEGMKLGAMIHDIGKIYVPAEILNRPGRLSVHEFGMIKTHPEVGYDIIKDVKFPWPVALMVLQHHERMDGSGYPKGLKGEEIILEARILAVADVMEAITAHRPYRPALGIDVALAEIEARRGQLYDPNVVAACLRLFREKGYTLENNGGAQ